MSNTREIIQRAFNGEICEKELHEKLDKRTAEQIVQDLKEGTSFEGLLNTRDCLESYLQNGNDEDTKEQVRKSLKYLYQAIRLRCNEMIAAEKQLKEMLNNC